MCVGLLHIDILHKIEGIEKSLTELFNRDGDFINESGIMSLSCEEQYAVDEF